MGSRRVEGLRRHPARSLDYYRDRRGYPGNCSVSGGSVPVCVVSKASDPEKHVNRLTYEGWSDGMLQDIERAQRARLTENHRMAVLPR